MAKKPMKKPGKVVKRAMGGPMGGATPPPMPSQMGLQQMAASSMRPMGQAQMAAAQAAQLAGPGGLRGGSPPPPMQRSAPMRNVPMGAAKAKGGSVKKRPYDAMRDESSRAITAMPYTETKPKPKAKSKAPPPKAKGRPYDPVKDEPTSRPFKKGGKVMRKAVGGGVTSSAGEIDMGQLMRGAGKGLGIDTSKMGTSSKTPSSKTPSSKGATPNFQNFSEAFRAARNDPSKPKTFTWKGKSYTTEMAGEKPAKKPAASASAPTKSSAPAAPAKVSPPRPRPKQFRAESEPRRYTPSKAPTATPAKPSKPTVYGAQPPKNEKTGTRGLQRFPNPIAAASRHFEREADKAGKEGREFIARRQAANEDRRERLGREAAAVGKKRGGKVTKRKFI